MSTFKSEYFKTADDLVSAKDDSFAPVKTRRDRLQIVRRFVNMIPTLSEAEKERLNRTEATNFGTVYRDMLANETMFTGMTDGTNALVEIIVDTDNVEQDTTLGVRLSEAINRGVIHWKGKFANFWRKCAGEITIAGGGPVTFSPKYGWLPELRTDMFFPRETSLDADQVPYAFDPVELTMADLKAFRAEVKSGEKGKVFQKKNLDDLIEALKKQIEERNRNSGKQLDGERSKSVRDEEFYDSTATISAWWFYEVKYTEAGDQYVSSTLFTDGIEAEAMTGSRDDKNCSAKVIAYWDKSHESASDWLQLVAVDSEIGGVKNLDTLRGVAELVFPAALEMEELFNLLLEGDKMRAKPRYKVPKDGNPDALLKWNMVLDSWVPEGVEELEHRTTSQGLLTPISLLRQTAASIAAAPVANTARGQELRQQALERQDTNASLIASRTAVGYNHLDAILETIVWRVLAGPVKPGTDGYHEIMWVRARLEKYGINYKELASRKHGRFEYLRVRARRMSGNGNRDEQLAISKWCMDNAVNFPPQVRPLIFHRAVVLQTGDPDFADAVAQAPQPIINAQKVTAENEADTIRRRVAIGEVLPVMPTDIHQDHVPVHIKDMQALLARNDLEPWKKIDVLEFGGLAEHTADHLQILLSNPATNPEGKMFLQAFQNVVQSAQVAIDAVEEAEGNENMQLTPKEQADVELKLMAEQRKAMELGIKIREYNRLQEQRASREALTKRKQYASEIQNDQRMKLDTVRTVAQIEAQKQSANQSKE